MQKRNPALVVVVVGVSLAIGSWACATSTQPPSATPPAVVQDEGVASPTSAESTTQATQQEPQAINAESASPTPSGPATQAPPIGVWPLEADLFYLNSAGQVWRQSLLGDETAASVITQLDQIVLDFAVSPGGEWLMYRTADFIGVREVTGTGGQLIANAGQMPPSVWPGHTMAWSPDAAKLAYTNATGFEVYIAGAGADFGAAIIPISELLIRDVAWSAKADYLLIWRDDRSAALYQVTQNTAGKWVELGEINSYAWLSDGRIAFAPAEGGLALLNPSDLNSRVFMVPQDRQVDLIGQRFDGSIAFFIHDREIEQAGYLNLGNPADLSFRQESGTAIDTANHEWTPGAVRLISRLFTDPNSSSVILTHPATGGTANFEASGQPISFGWSSIPPRSVAGLPLSGNLYFLAPQAGIIQVWKLPSTGDEPFPITAAAADVKDFDISPDGTQILYSSGGVLNRQAVGTSEITPVINLFSDARTTGTPDFSADGQAVAWASKGIWIQKPGENAVRLVSDNIPSEDREREIVVYSEPQWSPDGNWILARAGYYEGYDFVLIPVTGTNHTPIPLNLYITEATWTSDNRVLVYSLGGFYSDPALTLITPASPPVQTRIVDLPVIDAVQRPGGDVAFLRIPSPLGVGPTSVSLSTVPISGGGITSQSPSFVISSPQLSLAGDMIAGLLQMRVGEFGGATGLLAVANPATGEIFLIQGVTNVTAIRWGR